MNCIALGCQHRLAAALLLGASLLLHVQAWMLVSKDGEITLVAPLDINPSYDNARIAFKAAGQRQWDIHLDPHFNLHIRHQEVTNYVTVSPVSFSVYNAVSFGSSLAVARFTRLGSAPAVYGNVNFGSTLSLRDLA